MSAVMRSRSSMKVQNSGLQARITGARLTTFAVPKCPYSRSVSRRLDGHHGLDRDTGCCRGHRQGAAERDQPLAHANEAEAELVLGRQPASVVAYAHPRVAAAVSRHGLLQRLDRDVDRGRLSVAEH